MEHSEHHVSENLLSTTSRHETKSSNSVRAYSDPLIPDDLLVEIFSRVPAKSIARFRCVSKFLVSILDQATELFLTKSLTRPRLLFTVKATNGKLLLFSSPQSHNPDDNSSLVATPYHTSFPEYIPRDLFSTVCGLVLLQGWKGKRPVICNPVTGQFLTLPKVSLKEKNLPKVKAKSNRTKIAGMYLGYDPIGKQFKVLCMTSSLDERPNTHLVLTLKSGKRVWRTIEHEFHFEENNRMSGEICIDGVLYVGGGFGDAFGDGLSSRMVCFDVRSEKFSFINADEDMKLVGAYVVGGLTLFNYKGKLGIHENRYDNRLVMWILEDAGYHKWSKHVFVLSHSHYDIVERSMFVGVTSGETVVSASHHKPFYVVFFNLESKTFNRVYIQGLEEFNKHPYVTLHTFVDYVENIKSM
ncbi:F-box associated ubiquitination effector family protein [Raphanus sativus]|uniref:F-box protein At1g53360 n=1 Tax=Raphanus sativus TaxID=3726 RepID=A0A6J0KLN3_RAPSA|nr:putative F-box protein At1g53360 [Raphanus sativus]KAJ4880856.1 F-box associated ubiquitination effector family protein [Raphanus sativus]